MGFEIMPYTNNKLGITSFSSLTLLFYMSLLRNELFRLFALQLSEIQTQKRR